LDAPVAAILLPSITRFAVAAAGLTGPRDVRERLRLAEAGKLDEAEAELLGKELDVLAGLLERC
jgi:hypothetical protein